MIAGPRSWYLFRQYQKNSLGLNYIDQKRRVQGNRPFFPWKFLLPAPQHIYAWILNHNVQAAWMKGWGYPHFGCFVVPVQAARYRKYRKFPLGVWFFHWLGFQSLLVMNQSGFWPGYRKDNG